MDPFESFLKDQIHLLRKATGERVGPFKTALCEGRCSISDQDVDIAPGDVVVHRQEDKSEDHYPVRAVKLREAFHGIPGGQDLILGKKTHIPREEPETPREARSTGTRSAPSGPASRTGGRVARSQPRASASHNGSGTGIGSGFVGAVARGRAATNWSGGGASAAYGRGVQAQPAHFAVETEPQSANDEHQPDTVESADDAGRSVIHESDMEVIRNAFSALGRIIESNNVSNEAKVYAQNRIDALLQNPIVIKVMIDVSGNGGDRE